MDTVVRKFRTALSGFNRRLIICRCFAVFKAYCARGASRQAIAESVAIILSHKLCFAVHHADCALVASFGAKSAAVAFIFVYFNYFSYHNIILRFFCKD